MKSFTFLIFCFLLVNLSAQGQNKNKLTAQFQAKTNAKLTINSTNGTIEFVKFPKQNALKLKGNTLQEKALSFLENYKALYELENPQTDFILRETKTDNYGLRHVILMQLHNGVPVYDGQLRFHFNKKSELSSVNGNVISKIKLSATPVLSAAQAEAKAIQLVKNQKINYSGQPLDVFESRLYVFPKGLAQGQFISNHLVYEVEVRNNADVREFLYIDAHNGKLVEQFTGMAHALNRAVYEEDFGNQVYQEGDALPGDLDVWQENEVIASGHVYHFFNNAFGYESYDGAGITMRTINNNPFLDCPNANWNGVTANYCTGTASDDVIAHEWGHAYTQFTSGLIYAYQAGAINEAYSDIWGETVDLLNGFRDDDEDLSLRSGCNTSDRWRIGEDATAFSAPIRDLWNPPCNNDPGKVTDGQYRCSEADSGGVHSNSGIPNHAYALLVDGGLYNGQTINPIGFTKAAHIFWRAQSTYLTSTSDFIDLADALEASAEDLLGLELEGLSTSSIPAGFLGEVISADDVQQVVKAMLAVEMRILPEACNFQPLLAETDPLCDAAETGRVFFEDWETGTNGWSFEELPENSETWTTRFWTVQDNLPDGHAGNAIFAANDVIGDCVGDLENGIMRMESPEITLPNVTTGHFDLAFEHYVATENEWDGGNLKYRVNNSDWLLVPSDAFIVNPYNGAINNLEDDGNDNPMESQPAYTGTDGGSLLGSWGTSVINLSGLEAVAGDTVQFRWEFGTDGCNGRIGWYVDNIVVYNCTAETLAVSDLSLKNEMIVFPNPSNGFFTIKKTSSINLESAEVYDINGRVIQKVNLTNKGVETSIDLRNASSGIYFMKVRSNDSEAVFKLIKK